MFNEINEMLTPSVIKVQSDSPYHSRITLEPLERGYGHTLGNALRRILLSSMPGAAITEVTIDSVLHEYSTIPGVREDVVDILLNLKSVAIKMNSGREALLSIQKTGPGIVTAADIQTTHAQEIVNGDLIIAHLNEGVTLNMTIKVERGIAFNSTETLQIPEFEEAQTKSIGKLKLDACFSPVIKVAYAVDTARVENRTDLDKLIIDLETNGTIDPE